MKSLLLKLFIFFLPFMFLYTALEYHLQRLPNAYNTKKSYLETQLKEIKILSTGSSHGNSINPGFFQERGFNLSQNSQDLYYDVKLIQKYINQMPNLKLIIMPISYFSFESTIDTSPQKWRGSFYKLVWKIPNQSTIAKMNINNFSYTAAYGLSKIRSFLTTGDNKGILDDTPEKINKNGWSDNGNNHIREGSEEERLGWQSVSINESLMYPKNINANIHLLDELINICKTLRIQIVFVTTPVHHYYYEHIDPIKYQRMVDTISSLVNNHDLSYFNYFEDNRFEDTDFYNRDHLNSRGAEKFSKIIYEDFIKLYF